jgi:hypothetical protein
MVKDSEFKTYIYSLKEQLRKIEVGEKEVIKSNWESLKAIGRKGRRSNV